VVALCLAWLGTGALFSLHVAAAPLEIESVVVHSTLGEPLSASVRFRPRNGEHFGSECLSLGGEANVPSSRYPVLKDARVVLSANNTIEITTREAVATEGIVVVLRVQCPGKTLALHQLFLVVPLPRDTSALAVPHEKEASATIRGGGMRLTLLHDETAESIARAIHPTDAQAKARLADAIIEANPHLFAGGKNTRLAAGTRLVIPAAPGESIVPPSLVALPGPAEQQPALQPKLELKLEKEDLDVGRSAGVNEARRSALRRLYRGEKRVVVAAAAAPNEALELKVAQLRESQGAINQQLARLEMAVEALRRAIAAMVSAPPPSKPPTPSPLPAPPPPESTPFWREAPLIVWAGVVAAALLLVLLSFLLGRRSRGGNAMANHEARIDALLEQARSAAGPLLDTSAPPPRRAPSGTLASAPKRAREDAAPARRPAPTAAPTETTTEAAGLGTSDLPEIGPIPELPDFMKDSVNGKSAVDVDLGAAPAVPPPQAKEEPKVELKREMDLALDSARSMFTDVDRFIALGRTQNAISLLEFQVHKDPNDRDSWVKLMAVYRQEGMEAEFQRTFTAFKRKFPGDA
jgi:hypothetical protein